MHTLSKQTKQNKKIERIIVSSRAHGETKQCRNRHRHTHRRTTVNSECKQLRGGINSSGRQFFCTYLYTNWCYIVNDTPQIAK